MTPERSDAAAESSPILRAARGAVFVIHLFPAVMNGVAGMIFYLIASGGTGWGPAFLIGLSIFLIHAAIGSLNDFLDIELDRRTRPDKPLVRGDLSPRGAFLISAGAAVVGVGLSASFGLPVLLISIVVLAAGLAYDLWLKGTLVSWMPYGIAIPALPVWGFLAAGQFTPVLLLSFPLGILIALALYLANTIPDIEGDTDFGIAGLAQRLGVVRSLVVTWVCFGLTMALLALTPVLLGNDPALLWPGIGAGAVLLAAMVVDDRANRSQASFRRGWYMSAILAGVLGIAWVVSLPTI
jgi:4-hydroxybenzoate polyprenyltransferase